MTTPPLLRCVDRQNGTPCDRTGTHYVYDNDGVRVPGVWCEEHARVAIEEYHEKLGWHWTMTPVGPEAAR